MTYMEAHLKIVVGNVMLLVSGNVNIHAMQSMYDEVSIIYVYIYTYICVTHAQHATVYVL